MHSVTKEPMLTMCSIESFKTKTLLDREMLIKMLDFAITSGPNFKYIYLYSTLSKKTPKNRTPSIYFNFKYADLWVYLKGVFKMCEKWGGNFILF